MEKLIHKADGSLVDGNPFLIPGTKIGYSNKGSRAILNKGIVTVDSIEYGRNQGFNHPDYVWARWGSFDPSRGTIGFINPDKNDVHILNSAGEIIG